ncbi:MAG: AAA family ATPase [Candidatus Humimicrobiia bacterium]
MKEIPGLVYRKIDLHIHTPASKCFDDRSVSPEDIVKEALNKGLDAIAITDHNTGEWVDKIRKASKNKLVIFPGVEISATGGRIGTIHVIGIFAQSKTTKDIENLLGDLEIKADKYGKEDAFTDKTPNQVINKIYDHEGMAIIAHADSKQGVMGGMRGNPRIKIVQNPNLFAVEATDFHNLNKKRRKKRVVDLLDGSRPEYIKLAVYQASDNPSSTTSGKHSLEGIGSRYTYFKLDEISFEGLRQCFCDPDIRIKQMDELEIEKFPKITRMEVSQGFLKNQKIDFHEGLNSIVGGKGVGKSLIIEFLRFAIHQTSKDDSILNDHKDKLKKRLEPLGNVTVYFKLESGEQYKVIRTYDGSNNKIKCINLDTKELYEGDITALFPVLAYSQNEVIKIAEDEEAQLRLIDSFIDLTTYMRSIQKLSQELTKRDKELAKSIKALSEVASYRKELNTIREQLKSIRRSLKNKLFDEMEKWERKKTTIEKYLSFHNGITQKIDQMISNSDEITKPRISKELSKDPQIKKAKRLFDESYNKMISSMKNAKEKIIKNKENLSESFDKWVPKFKKKQEQYEDMLREVGGDKRELESERRKLKGKEAEIEKEIEKYTNQSEKLDKVKKSRDSLLDTLTKVYDEYYEIRKQKFDDLTSQSKGKLKLELSHSANRGKFKEELLVLKKGSRIREADIEKVSQNLMPREFVDLVINNDIDSLADKADLAEENAKKLIDTLNSKEALEDVLAISHSVYPKDIPSIKFRKEDGNYNPLSELSVGQKCTALLIIALSEGVRPIIIDQPEDSLDNSSIYKDVVTKLRTGKEKRQFILTTNNSSVGVASDSDNFIILKSTATQGYIECFGALDKDEVRSKVINHLEGGPKPYKLKSKKYNIKQ